MACVVSAANSSLFLVLGDGKIDSFLCYSPLLRWFITILNLTIKLSCLNFLHLILLLNYLSLHSLDLLNRHLPPLLLASLSACVLI